MAKGHSLTQLLDELSDQTGHRTAIRTRLLADIGIAEDVPVEVALDGTTLGNTLHILLRLIDYDLDCYVEDGVFFVTTAEDVEKVENQRLQQQMFDIRDLLAPAHGTTVRHVWRDEVRVGGVSGDFAKDSLLEVIRSMIGPNNWSDVGGAWTIQSSRELLIVNAPRQTNQQIAALLSQLRLAKGWDGRDQSMLERFVRPKAVTWKPFDIPVTLAYQERPLAEVVGDISLRYKVPVLLDYASLRDIGLDGDVPVTIDVKNMPLRDALQRLLRPIDPDLGVHLSRGVMMIVTDLGCGSVATHIYPVRDLATNERELEELAKLLHKTVAPESWDEVGGMGSVHVFSPANTLVVSQSAEILDRVDAFFAELRNQLAKRTADHSPAPADEVHPNDATDEQWPIVAYHVYLPIGFNEPDEKRFGTLAVLPPLVRRLTGEDHWQDDRATIEILGAILIVRQTPAVQRRVEQLLRDLNVLLTLRSGICVSVTPVVGDNQANPESAR
ncbi:MAG: hypothetical protein WD030_04385 [Pirellulales bacterium]